MPDSAAQSAREGASCLFVQSFSIGHVGGGPRILQSVIERAPMPVSSICTGFYRSLAPNRYCDEVLEAIRPPLGRLDRTRFAHLGGWVEGLCSPFFRKRLRARILAAKPSALHVVPHSWGDFVAVHGIARELRIPIHASFHDDLDYTAGRHPLKRLLMRRLGELWREAATRFVISEEIGEEYCRRYGRRPYLIHTDGVSEIASSEWEPPTGDLRVYFMGMMNQPYVANVRSMARALPLLAASSGWKPSFKIRTHGYTPEEGEITELLPFADPAVIREELPRQHLLYLPLPLGQSYEGLWRFGFSTKLVSYLASGTPIVYHGPAEAAAGRYLAKHDAAVCIHTDDPAAVAEALKAALADPELLREKRRNALIAAKRDFDATVLHRRFWDAIRAAISL